MKIILILLIFISIVNGGKSGTEYFQEHVGAHLGFNQAAGTTLVSIVVGTPLFFIIHFFLTRREKLKKEELELKEIQKKINSRRRLNTNNDGAEINNRSPRNSDYYGTNKILKECISRHNSVSQLYVSSSSPIATTTTVQPNHPPLGSLTGSPLNLSSNSLCTSTATNTPVATLNNKSNSSGYLTSTPPPPSGVSGGSNSANNSPRRFHERLMTPPSPILSTFGGNRKPEDNNATDATYQLHDEASSPTQGMKRTISGDSKSALLSSPTSVRPKSLTLSTNASLLNLLSSNTIPKDHWHCIVYRVLELAMSFWMPPKHDGQAPYTSLTQIELSLSGFSEQEQLKKQIITIDDQKYFSPIIFEMYSKILPIHDFIRSRSSIKNDKDINGVTGVLNIILPSLFNSYINWSNETSLPNRRKQLISCQENLIDTLSSDDILERSFIHKVSIHYLTLYIRHLLFYSSKGYNGSTLYKIIDLYHGVADDIDKLLFEISDSYQDFEELQKIQSAHSSFHEENPFKVDAVNQDCSLLSIITSISNRFSHIDNYLDQQPSSSSSSSTQPSSQQQQQPSLDNIVGENDNNNNNQSSLITLQQQKSIISSCYNHLSTALSIFSATEIFSSKFKVDTIPMLKMMLATLNSLEEQMDAGVSISDMSPGDLLEWTNTFTRIATSLNNAILKNSSILMASQIVDMNLNGSTNSGITPSSTSNMMDPSSTSPSPSSNSNHFLRRSAKIKPPSSPFGSPAIMSFLMADGALHDHHLLNSESPSHRQQHIPATRERCAQMVQLSQDSIMFAVMSTFSIYTKSIKKDNNHDQVGDYFTDSLGVFLSAIRTNIFCTYILLNPIYELQS